MDLGMYIEREYTVYDCALKGLPYYCFESMRVAFLPGPFGIGCQREPNSDAPTQGKGGAVHGSATLTGAHSTFVCFVMRMALYTSPKLPVHIVTPLRPRYIPLSYLELYLPLP